MKIRSKLKSYFPTSLALTSLAAIALTIYSCQDYNSHSFDGTKFAATGCTSGDALSDAECCAAYTVLRTQCSSCHNRHQEWATPAYTLIDTWKSANGADGDLVTPGNATTSAIYASLADHGSGTMPKGNPALSNAEALAIQSWINGLTP